MLPTATGTTRVTASREDLDAWNALMNNVTIQEPIMEDDQVLRQALQAAHNPDGFLDMTLEQLSGARGAAVAAPTHGPAGDYRTPPRTAHAAPRTPTAHTAVLGPTAAHSGPMQTSRMVPFPAPKTIAASDPYLAATAATGSAGPGDLFQNPSPAAHPKPPKVRQPVKHVARQGGLARSQEDGCYWIWGYRTSGGCEPVGREYTTATELPPGRRWRSQRSQCDGVVTLQVPVDKGKNGCDGPLCGTLRVTSAFLPRLSSTHVCTDVHTADECHCQDAVIHFWHCRQICRDFFDSRSSSQLCGHVVVGFSMRGAEGRLTGCHALACSSRCKPPVAAHMLQSAASAFPGCVDVGRDSSPDVAMNQPCLFVPRRTLGRKGAILCDCGHCGCRDDPLPRALHWPTLPWGPCAMNYSHKLILNFKNCLDVRLIAFSSWRFLDPESSVLHPYEEACVGCDIAVANLDPCFTFLEIAETARTSSCFLWYRSLAAVRGYCVASDASVDKIGLIAVNSGVQLPVGELCWWRNMPEHDLVRSRFQAPLTQSSLYVTAPEVRLRSGYVFPPAAQLDESRDVPFHRLQRMSEAMDEGFVAFIRSFLLFYLLSCARMIMFACKLEKRSSRTNCAIRSTRSVLKGAPLWLAFAVLAHLIPVTVAAPKAGRAAEAHAHGHAPLGLREALASQVGNMRPAPCDVGLSHSALSVAEGECNAHGCVFRYQKSCCHAATWLDPGDTSGLACRAYHDELFCDAETRLVPVCPQPNATFVALLDAPEWICYQLLTPVLIEIHGPRIIRYMEVTKDCIDLDAIRLMLGNRWPVAGRVFVGDSLQSLAPDQPFRPFPGTLIRVFPERWPVQSCVGLDKKLRVPSRWFRHVECSPSDLAADEEKHVGLVGPWGDWATTIAAPLKRVHELREEVRRLCAGHGPEMMVLAPVRQPPDLFFRGDKVASTVAVMPKREDLICCVFLDARELAIPVSTVFLPHVRTTLTRVLEMAGGSRPYGVNLCVEGALEFDPASETLLPTHKAMLQVTVNRTNAWDDDYEHFSPVERPLRRRRIDRAMRPDSMSLPCSGGVPYTDPDGASSGDHLLATVEARHTTTTHAPIGHCAVLGTPYRTERAASPAAPVAGSPDGGSTREVEFSARPDSAVSWQVPVRVFRFQRQAVYHSLEISIDESKRSFLQRLERQVVADDNLCEMYVPDPQPRKRYLSVLVAPKWWRHRGRHVVLVACGDSEEDDFSAVVWRGVTVPDVLPPLSMGPPPRLSLFCSEGEVGQNDEVRAGMLMFLQTAGRHPPSLPAVDAILDDPGLHVPADPLPDEAAICDMRYVLLGLEDSQFVIDLQYGPVSPQIASMVGIDRQDLVFWFQTGTVGSFDTISVGG